MKRLSIIIEALTEEEIIKVLSVYVKRAREGGCYSSMTNEGPEGQGVIATFHRTIQKRKIPGMRAEIIETAKRLGE
jgi:hypothetical protein